MVRRFGRYKKRFEADRSFGNRVLRGARMHDVSEFLF